MQTPQSDVVERIGPALSAASNFGHGWDEATLSAAIRLGVRDFRDTIYWNSVETEEGIFVFDGPTTTYPAQIAAAGATMSLTVNWGNDLYDGGFTPYTPDGRAAFARFVVAALDAFPAITAVEVGNEFNGRNFVDGPVKETVLADRATEHFKILKAVHEAVKASRPDVAVLGGATHSIPGGYIWPLLDLGGRDYMDALVLHPYTTPPEHLKRQIDFIRRHPAMRGLPIQVTEFGTKARNAAPGFLLRMYCAMAVSGVERVVWYPLNDRGDGHWPLIDPESARSTPEGRAFQLAQEMLAGRPVTDVSPDPFTHACLFDDRTLVIWGEPRAVLVEGDVTVVNAVGVKLDPLVARLSTTDPLVITAEGPLVLGETVSLGPTDLLADSFYQFGYPPDSGDHAPGDPFLRFAQRGDQITPLHALPGQDASGTPWNPYLGNRFIRPARLLADMLVPGGTAEEPLEIVHRYIANMPRQVSIEGHWTPARRSSDGIDITIRHGDKVLAHSAGVSGTQALSIPSVSLEAGDRLDFIVGPGATPSGDLTEFRIVLRMAE